MARTSFYKVLGLQPGAGTAEIKKAYRRLAKKYHPDINATADAAEKFLEITRAHDELLGDKSIPGRRQRSYSQAEQIIRKEREKAKAKEEARAREKAKAREKAIARERERVRQQEEAHRRFRASGWYDLLRLSRFAMHILLLCGSIAAIVVPLILGFLIEPAVFLATIYFMIIGTFGVWYIYSKRKSWFRLGPMNINREKLVSWLKRVNWKN